MEFIIKIYLSFIFLLSINALAFNEGSSIEKCTEVASQKLMDSSAVSLLKEDCYSHIKSESLKNQKQFIIMKNGDQIFAHKNMIFIQESLGQKSLRFISGSSTHLNDIISIHLTNDESEIIVLNRTEEGSKEILGFYTSRSGNISPHLVNNEKFVNSLSNISLSDQSNKIIGVNSDDFTIVEIDKNADSRTPVISRKPAAVQKLSSQDHGHEDLKGSQVYKDSLYILDENYGLSKVDKNNQLKTIISKVDLAKTLTEPYLFKSDAKTGQLKLMDNSGNFYLIKE